MSGEKQTGSKMTDSQKENIISFTNTIVNSFDSNKTVEEYYEDLKNQTTEKSRKKH